MIRQSITAVSAALCVTLVGYGISQAAVPLLDEPVKKAPVSKEAKLLASLNLSAKQKAEYDQTVAWFKAETAKMKQLGGGAMKRGMEINAEWKEKLQKVFTRDQYRTYMRNNGALIESDGTYLATNYGKSREDEILAKLNLSNAQKQAIEELYAQLRVEIKKLDKLWEGTDSYAIGIQGSKINEMQRAGMSRILTPQQHDSYLRLWAGPVDPNAKPDPNAYSPGKPMPRGIINP